MNIVVAQGFGTFWELLANSGPVGLTVLLILLFFSLLSWSVIFRKWSFFKKAEAESADFYDEFRRRSSLSEIHSLCDRFPTSPLAGIFRSGFRELHSLRSVLRGGLQAGREAQVLTSLERSLHKAAQSEMTVLERSMEWLATTGAVTPFIGLFGTVVGIINAFQGLGGER